MNREEEAIIKLEALEERLAAAQRAAAPGAAAPRPAELAALKASFVDFHGEAVLLLHWSLINYSGVVKVRCLGGRGGAVELLARGESQGLQEAAAGRLCPGGRRECCRERCCRPFSL